MWSPPLPDAGAWAHNGHGPIGKSWAGPGLRHAARARAFGPWSDPLLAGALNTFFEMLRNVTWKTRLCSCCYANVSENRKFRVKTQTESCMSPPPHPSLNKTHMYIYIYTHNAFGTSPSVTGISQIPHIDKVNIFVCLTASRRICEAVSSQWVIFECFIELLCCCS